MPKKLMAAREKYGFAGLLALGLLLAGGPAFADDDDDNYQIPTGGSAGDEEAKKREAERKEAEKREAEKKEAEKKDLMLGANGKPVRVDYNNQLLDLRNDGTVCIDNQCVKAEQNADGSWKIPDKKDQASMPEEYRDVSKKSKEAVLNSTVGGAVRGFVDGGGGLIGTINSGIQGVQSYNEEQQRQYEENLKNEMPGYTHKGSDEIQAKLSDYFGKDYIDGKPELRAAFDALAKGGGLAAGKSGAFVLDKDGKVAGGIGTTGVLLDQAAKAAIEAALAEMGAKEKEIAKAAGGAAAGPAGGEGVDLGMCPAHPSCAGSPFAQGDANNEAANGLMENNGIPTPEEKVLADKNADDGAKRNAYDGLMAKGDTGSPDGDYEVGEGGKKSSDPTDDPDGMKLAGKDDGAPGAPTGGAMKWGKMSKDQQDAQFNAYQDQQKGREKGPGVDVDAAADESKAFYPQFQAWKDKFSAGVGAFASLFAMEGESVELQAAAAKVSDDPNGMEDLAKNRSNMSFERQRLQQVGRVTEVDDTLQDSDGRTRRKVNVLVGSGDTGNAE